MGRTTRSSRHWGSRFLISPTMTLALWQLRTTWRLLLVISIGIIAAVMLVCTVSLYSQLAMSAGLRGVLNASSQNADIIVDGSSTQISSAKINDITQHLDREFQKNLGPYLGQKQFSFEQQFSLFANIRNRQGKNAFRPTGESMELTGSSMNQAASHLKLIQGRLPRSSSDVLEIAVSQQTYNALQFVYKPAVGSVLNTSISFTDASQTIYPLNLKLRIVGVFNLATIDDPFWHGNDFVSSNVQDEPIHYKGLVSNDAIVSMMSQIRFVLVDDKKRER